MGVCGPTHDERSWTFDLDPGGRDPVLGLERLQEAYLARFPGYEQGITVPAIVDVRTGQVVTNDFAQITLDLSTEWRAHHRAGAPDLYPRHAARRDRRGQRGRLRRRQQRRLPLRVRRLAGGLRARLRPAVRPPRLAVGAAAQPALPGRRHDHRGRRAAVHDAGPVRRRVPRPLQVQPPEADRAAGAVGLRPGPVPDARASATRSTSSTSSGTTTRSTATSTRPASCPPAPTSPAGWRPTAARRSAAARSATAPRPARRPPRSACPPTHGTPPPGPDPSASCHPSARCGEAPHRHSDRTKHSGQTAMPPACGGHPGG